MVGLTSHEAAKRLAHYGPNEVAPSRRITSLMAFLSHFRNPLVLVLLVAAVIAAFFGDTISFVIIVAIVLISISLDFTNTRKSEAAAEALRERVRVYAQVVRDGKTLSLPHSQVVPGDVIAVRAGSLIPADGKVLEGKTLYLNESVLTGESLPQGKKIGAPVYMGSNVESGEGLIEVTATGAKTRYAHIAQALNQKDTVTAFDREIRDFSFLIVRITTGLLLFIFAINLIFKHDILHSLLFSLALAVGLTPELLPLIVTITLTRGSLAMAKRRVIVKHLAAIHNFGSMDVLCTDKTGTLTENKIILVKHVDALGQNSATVLRYSYVSSKFTHAYDSPLEEAIRTSGHLSLRDFKRIEEIPFDFERRRGSVVLEEKGHRILVSKGSPDELLQHCTHYDENKRLTENAKSTIRATYEGLSRSGFRVLGVAVKAVHVKDEYAVADEHDMTFLGFVAFLDPAKRGVQFTLEHMRKYGVAVKIITGDNALVSERIAHDINLPVDAILTGQEMNHLSDAALRHKVDSTTIFARVSPEQKMRIIQALQHQGHVVGYLGDGINDAPALKAADIGISVNNAVDVAKEAADFILLHKNLSDLIEGIIEGRKIFANTLKYLMLVLSSNLGNMFSLAGASIILPFLPMQATQILLNNLLYDTSQLAIPGDAVDGETLLQPRQLHMSFVKRFIWLFGPISSLFDLLTFGLLYWGFHLSGPAFQTGWFLESLATQTLVVHIIRTQKIPFLQSRPSLILFLSTLFIIELGVVFVYSPLGGYFHFVPLPSLALWGLAVIVLLYLCTVQLVKAWAFRPLQTKKGTVKFHL